MAKMNDADAAKTRKNLRALFKRLILLYSKFRGIKDTKNQQRLSVFGSEDFR